MSFTYSRQQLTEAAALTDEDMIHVHQCRRPHNRLGFAYQVGFVRLLNRFPRQEAFELVEELLAYVSTQLELAGRLIEAYQQRRQTVAEHQVRIMEYLKLRRLSEADTTRLADFLFEEACRLEQTAALQARVQDYLKTQRIVLPGETTLTRLIGEQRQRARAFIDDKIAACLPAHFEEVLAQLLPVPAGRKVSPLQQIKANPRNPSPEAMLALLQKLNLIEATGVLAIDLAWLNSNYQRALFHYVNRCSVDRWQQLVPARRNAAWVCFLWQSYRDAVDQAVDMYDKLITWVYTQAEQALDEQLRRQRKTIQGSLAALKSLGQIILDETVPDRELRARLFDKVPKDLLAAQVEALNEGVSGKKSDGFFGVVSRFSYLRQFAPAFLRALDFKPEIEGKPACLDALELLRALNAGNKRTLPADAPTDFVPQPLQPFIRDTAGKLTKSAWECALLTQLRDEIRAGNLSVTHSKRFGRFDDFFIPVSHWERLREGVVYEHCCQWI
jgi:uncharacterized protein DUF4158